MTESIEIGVITRAHGLAGMVQVKLFTVDPRILERLEGVVLRFPDGREAARALLRIQPGSKGHPVVRLTGCDSRTEAEALRGALLVVERAALGPLEADEFYLSDAVGCRVVEPDGTEIGHVEQIGDNGAQALFLIRGPLARYNVPAVPEFIVSFEGGTLVLALPVGLLTAVADPIKDPP